MDISSIWWLFLFLIMVAIIILVKINREKFFRKTSGQSKEEIPEMLPTVKAVNEVAMYVYDEPINGIRCPFCDGENPASVQYCEICGNRLVGKEG